MPMPGGDQYNYLRFLDGLRGVAIILVILYHIGAIPGGFVGVDVFFIISGFLIIGQIVAAFERGNFSFSDFWARRVFRILPTYLLVIVACAAVAPLFLVSAAEYAELSKEIGYSAIMAVNHYFVLQQGYFDQSADSKILLHLWSLAVEEQFYIVCPIVVFGIMKLPRRARVPVVGSLFLASLVSCILLTGVPGDGNYAFYLMPLRAWEFIAGGAAAYLVPYVSRLPRWGVEELALAGVGAIAFAGLRYTALIGFPSYRALLPAFGAVAVITAGIVAPRSIVARLLAFRPLVWTGLISYALYLWHWPVLLFLRIYNFDGHLSKIGSIAIVVSVGLAFATWLFVERPILRWRRRRPRVPFGWRPAAAGVVVCVATALAGYSTINAGSTTAAARQQAIMVTANTGCFLVDAASAARCAGPHAYGLLIGDSHAMSAASVLTAAAKQAGKGLASVAGGACASMFLATVTITDSLMDTNCRTYRHAMLDLFGKGALTPEFAVLYSRWALYTGEEQYTLADPEWNGTDPQKVFVETLQRSVAFLKAHGTQRILVIGPTPVFTKEAPECFLRAARFGVDRSTCATTTAANDAVQRKAKAWLEEAVVGSPGVRFVDPSSAFCDEDICVPYARDAVLFVDTNHIDDTGFERLMAAFPEQFDWVLGTGTDPRHSEVARGD